MNNDKKVAAPTPKLKKDGTPKKSGGARKNAGAKKKAAPDGYLPWPEQLQRALRLAANNNFVLPRAKFFTKTQVKNIYGFVAYEEFSRYFASVLRFDQDRADAVRQRQALGLFGTPPTSWPEDRLGQYTPEKYAAWLIDHKCFGWMTILRDEYHREMWKKYADHGRT